jgi:hypothetical protein
MKPVTLAIATCCVSIKTLPSTRARWGSTISARSDLYEVTSALLDFALDYESLQSRHSPKENLPEMIVFPKLSGLHSFLPQIHWVRPKEPFKTAHRRLLIFKTAHRRLLMDEELKVKSHVLNLGHLANLCYGFGKGISEIRQTFFFALVNNSLNSKHSEFVFS